MTIREDATAAASRVSEGSRRALDSAVPLASGLLATTQGLLASDLSSYLNGLLANVVKGPVTFYGKAIDAEYLATFIGGANHRMFDGGHSLLGAIKAVRDASPDDSVIEEVSEFLQELFRDMTTVKGLPLATWDKATFAEVAGFLETNLRIPKDWFYDLNSYDAAELLGGVIGIVATALCWNRADTETFSKLVGGMGVSALVSANPLLLLITVIALAKAFHKAHRTGDFTALVDGALKGSIGAGSTLAAVSLVGALGGPAGIALLAGLSAGVLANKTTKNFSLTPIGELMTERATVVATEIRKAADPYIRAAEANRFNPARIISASSFVVFRRP